MQRVNARRSHALNEAQGLCLGGVKRASGQQQFHRPALADQAYQPRRAAPAGRQTVVYLAKGEAGLGRGQAQIAGGQDFAAAAHRVAVHRGHDRIGQLGQPGQGRAHHPVQPLAGRRFGMTGQLLQIAAGDERLARAGDDEDADGLVAAGGGHGVGERFLSRPTEGIAGRRPVDPQQGDAVAIYVELNPAAHTAYHSRKRPRRHYR